MRFCSASSSVMARSGRTISSGMPGKPAPVPTSMQRAAAGSSGAAASESKKCFSATASGSVMAVRLRVLFHSTSSV